ncbi:MAG TPA: SDR family NAD(P)-dependent oxidoreductase [Verrucomicrobiae bacterium]|nr:SDR family NAD(P)-dependent oxidoreductase [Verrucomicrobiae bacterium]
MARASRPVALISGVAAGLGASLADAFAAAGYDIIGLARSNRAAAEIAALVAKQGGSYLHHSCDITQPIQVATALQRDAKRIAVAVHNAQALLIKPFGEISPDEFEEVWRVGCFGAMVVAQAVLPAMAARGHGVLIFTGATAAIRGGAKFTAFASAKFALRGLAQALAREYGASGIHVAHVVLDGLVEGPQTDRRFGPAPSARFKPDEVAQTYLQLASQPPSAWTQEIDLRPSAERY